jgi:hypothetical protein
MSDPNQFKSVIAGIVNSQPMNTRRDNLPPGNHQVAICRYQAVPQLQMNPALPPTHRMEATFVILKSDQPNIQPGTVYDWTWHINAEGWRGRFETDRARTFLSLGREGLGSPETGEQIGDKLASGEYRGMQWMAHVTPVLDDNGQQRYTAPKKNSNSRPKPLRNADFSPVPQDLATIAHYKAHLEANHAGACADTPPRQQQGQFAQAPHPAQMQGQYPQYAQQYQQAPQPQYAPAPAQAPTPQFAPQPPAPQYAPAPVGYPAAAPQYAPVPAPQGPPPGVPMVPAGYAQAPTGYAPPITAGLVPAPPAPQGVALSQVAAHGNALAGLTQLIRQG